jgi:hypothetical protein
MRDLARNLESLQERLNDKAAGRRGLRDGKGQPQGQAPGERQGQRGQDGQQGREGQPQAQGEGQESEGEGQGAGGQAGARGQQEGRARADGSSGRESAAGSAQGGPGGGGVPDDGLAAGGPPRFAQGDARQVRRELRERLREAEAIGRELGAGGPYDLRDVVRGMRRLDDEGLYGEPRGLARLVGSVVEGLKSAEFALRREIEGPDREKLFQTGSQDLPPGWQRLVEEYYRSLSRRSEPAR